MDIGGGVSPFDCGGLGGGCLLLSKHAWGHTSVGRIMRHKYGPDPHRMGSGYPSRRKDPSPHKIL